MTISTKVNSFTILKTKNQFIMLKNKIMAYVHQFLYQPSQWQTSQQAGPGSVPKFTSTSITVKQLLIKNKNINQSKSSLLIWHYVSYLFLFNILVELALHTVSLLGQLVLYTYTLFGTLKIHYGNGRVVMALDSGSDVGPPPPRRSFFFFCARFFLNYNIHDILSILIFHK